MIGFETKKNEKKVAFKVIDFRSFFDLYMERVYINTNRLTQKRK